eukprot:SAG22_NODE_1024_length_5987_cov_3.799932_3_plen_46_part_00
MLAGTCNIQAFAKAQEALRAKRAAKKKEKEALPKKPRGHTLPLPS